MPQQLSCCGMCKFVTWLAILFRPPILNLCDLPTLYGFILIIPKKLVVFSNNIDVPLVSRSKSIQSNEKRSLQHFNSLRHKQTTKCNKKMWTKKSQLQGVNSNYGLMLNRYQVIAWINDDHFSCNNGKWTSQKPPASPGYQDASVIYI